MEFYKNIALEFSRQQMTFDLFSSAQYADIATIGLVTQWFLLKISGSLSQITGGQVYHYPNFTAKLHAQRLAGDLLDNLQRVIGYEAVMRIRCSKGILLFSILKKK